MEREIIAQHHYVRNNKVCFRITTVAVISPGYDWAAYQSVSLEAHHGKSDHPDHLRIASPNLDLHMAQRAICLTEELATEQAREYGNKLPEEVALATFPIMKGRKERYSG